MEFKYTLEMGDEEGRFTVLLLQCPACKNIEIEQK